MASVPVLKASPGNTLKSSASANMSDRTGSVKTLKQPIGSPMRASCQWFDMSPRQSIESPTQRPPRGFDVDENEENAVPNVAKIQPTGKTEKVAMRSAKTTQPMAAQQSPPSTRSTARRPGTSPQSARASLGRDQVLPCMRQHTPTRKGADGCSRAESPLASSARKSASISREASVPATPDARADFAEASVCNTSMYSDFSCSSRLSQLSRRSTTRKHLSTEELIHQQMEERKRIVAKQIQRNQVNCVKAKHPDPAYASGRMKHSTRVTLPKEFSLSQSTPRRRESRNFDGEESVCSLKSVSSVKSVDSVRKKQAASAAQAATPGSARKWKPSLTVPRGPSCIEEPRTRRSISHPPQERDDVSEMSVGSVSSRKSLTRQTIPLRSATPEKRVTRAATPENRTTQPTRAATPEGRNGQTTRVATPQRRGEPVREGTPQRRQPLQAVHEKATVQQDKERAVRAELARKAAEEKSAAEQATRNSERHCIFKRPQQPTSPSKLESGQSVNGSVKTLSRRPSFGSSSARF